MATNAARDCSIIGTAAVPLVLAAGVPKTWTHNKGVRALMVQATLSPAGDPRNDVVTTQPSVNQITLTSAAGATIVVLVTWTLLSQDAAATAAQSVFV